MNFSLVTLLGVTSAIPSGVLAQSAPVGADAEHSAPMCNIRNWGAVDETWLNDGISYLKKHGGTCNSPANSGANGCTRVSCENDSAIFLCNDNNYAINPPCSDVADMTTNIMKSCVRSTQNAWVITGQQFYYGDAEGANGYNVIVRDSSC